MTETQDIAEMIEEIENKVEEKDELIEELQDNFDLERRQREKHQKKYVWEKLDNEFGFDEYDMEDVEFSLSYDYTTVTIDVSRHSSMEFIVDDNFSTNLYTVQVQGERGSARHSITTEEELDFFKQFFDAVKGGGEILERGSWTKVQTADGDLLEFDFREHEVNEVDAPSNWFTKFDHRTGEIGYELGDLVAVEQEDYRGVFYIFEDYTLFVKTEFRDVQLEWMRIDAENVLMQSERDIVEIDDDYNQQAVASMI